MTGAIAGIALLLWLTREREPEYQGKTLSEWLAIYADAIEGDQAQSELSIQRRTEAALAIRQIGTNALPHLLEWTAYEGPSTFMERFRSLRRQLPESNSSHSFRHWCLSDCRWKHAEHADYAFELLEDQAKSAIPELARRMNIRSSNDIVAARAVFELACIGKAAAPILAEQLANTNAPNRHYVAFQFASFPVLYINNPAMIALLARCAEDSDEEIAGAITYCLALTTLDHPSQPELVVPVLRRRLEFQFQGRGTNIYHSYSNLSIQALGAFGDKAKEAVPILKNLAEPGVLYRGSDTWEAAASALQQIAPEVLSNAPPK